MGGSLCSESSKAFEKSMSMKMHGKIVHEDFRVLASG